MKIVDVFPIVFTLLTCSPRRNNVVAANNKRYARNIRRIDEEDSENRSLQVDIQPRIVGGSITSGTEHPYFAIPINGRGLCGATLIHSDILVSAAHCAGIFEGNEVALGASSITGSDALEIISVQAEYPNPNFSYNSLENDVMIIKLKTPSTATPVPLNNISSIPADGQASTVIGFGATYEDGRPSRTLLEAQVEVVDFQTCYDKYWQPFWGSNIVDDKMICAGTPSGSTKDVDSCQGDSGGPLFSSSGAIIGIVSFGSGCGRSGIPGVYTRISGVLDFVRTAVCDLSSSPPNYCSSNGGSGGGGTGGGGAVGVPVAGDTGDDTPSSTEPEPPVSDGSDCDLGCSYAWVFSGIVLHKDSGSACEEYCVFAYVDSFLARGYNCGLCPN
jgi:trypsin